MAGDDRLEFGLCLRLELSCAGKLGTQTRGSCAACAGPSEATLGVSPSFLDGRASSAGDDGVEYERANEAVEGMPRVALLLLVVVAPLRTSVFPLAFCSLNARQASSSVSKLWWMAPDKPWTSGATSSLEPGM